MGDEAIQIRWIATARLAGLAMTGVNLAGGE